jgi:hypothetical protein
MIRRLMNNSPDELVPSMLLGNVIEHLQLPCGHRASTDVPYFTAVDHIIQGTHDLLRRGIAIEAMNLEDVNVRPQPTRHQW